MSERQALRVKDKESELEGELRIWKLEVEEHVLSSF